MRILIINGPNLNLLGKREPEIYGKRDFDSFFQSLENEFPNHTLSYFQSNSESEIIDRIQVSDNEVDGIVLNAGAYTHTSLAIADALASIKTPVVEVHISNIFAREEFRHISFTAAQCVGIIAGLGLEGYHLAVKYLVEK